MSRYWLGLCFAFLLSGCATTHEQMLDHGYPPAYADGFQDGCSSGRQAAGLMVGDFRKDVPRYLHNRQYESGWDDGFRQCHALQNSATVTGSRRKTAALRGPTATPRSQSDIL